MSTDLPIPRFAALQHRDFRLLWIGQLVATIGAQMQLIAINWHVYELLRGSAYTIWIVGRPIELDAKALGLGTLGLARIVPIILFALVGGVLADTHDRRRLMIWTRAAAASLAGILALLAWSGRASVGAIYLITAIGAAVTAFDSPARQALVPNLVPREHLTNAISLNTLMWQIGTITGPALAGVLVGQFAVSVVYALAAFSFVVMMAMLWLMRYRGGAAARNVGLGWDALLEGLRFTYRSRIIWSTMLLDFFATFFSSANTMLPIVASDILGVGVQGYGLLATGQPVGAVVAGLILALRRDIRRQGLVLLVSVAVYGLATAAFGLSTIFALSYLFYSLTGAADTVSTVIRNTIRQLLTPDELRGRMTSVNMVFFMGGPQLGEMEAGLVAAAFGPAFSIVSGGLATALLTAWVAWRFPRLRCYVRDESAAASGT